MKKLLYIFLGCISLNAYTAGSTYDVTKGALQNNTALCGYGYNPNCGSQPQYRQQPTEIIDIEVPSRYGAWALNPKTGISANAINAPSLEVAKEGAIKTCEEGGNAPCKVFAWVENGCLAVAQGSKGKMPKAYPRSTRHRYRAEAEALKRCRDAGEPKCKIIVPEGCSLPYGA